MRTTERSSPKGKNLRINVVNIPHPRDHQLYKLKVKMGSNFMKAGMVGVGLSLFFLEDRTSDDGIVEIVINQPTLHHLESVWNATRFLHIFQLEGEFNVKR